MGMAEIPKHEAETELATGLWPGFDVAFRRVLRWAFWYGLAGILSTLYKLTIVLHEASWARCGLSGVCRLLIAMQWWRR